MNRLARMILKNFRKVPWAYGTLCRYAKNPQQYTFRQMWDHIQAVMQLAIAQGNVNLRVTGVEHLPEDGGFLLCGNHQGMFDVIAIAASCPIPLGAVYKKELENVPFLNKFCKCTRSYAMDREDVRQSLGVIQQVTQELKQGRSYLIFPEGTRSRTGNHMGQFHPGSFRCALKAKCPIVPMAFIDSFQVLDQKGCDPIDVQLHYLEPIPYEAYGHLKTTEIAQLVKDKIQQQIDRCL